MTDDLTPTRRAILAAAADDGQRTVAVRRLAGVRPSPGAEPRADPRSRLPERVVLRLRRRTPRCGGTRCDPRRVPHRPGAALRAQPHQHPDDRPARRDALRRLRRRAERRRAPRPTRCHLALDDLRAAAGHGASPPCTSAPATAAASSPRSRAHRRRARRGQLGAVGTVGWEGVRLARRAETGRDSAPMRCRSRPPASTRTTSSGGVDYGPVRRPFPVAKALDDAILAWGMNGEPLLPDHGYPLRLVLPGWVGIGSIKWLGSLEVSDDRAHLAVEHEVVPDDRRRLPGRQPAADRQPGPLGVGAAGGRRAAQRRQDPADRSLVERGRRGSRRSRSARDGGATWQRDPGTDGPSAAAGRSGRYTWTRPERRASTC